MLPLLGITLVSVAVSACGQDRSPSPGSTPTGREKEPRQTSLKQPGEPIVPVPLSPPPENPVAPVVAAQPTGRGKCRLLGEPVPIADAAGPARLVPSIDGFAIAAYRRGPSREDVVLATLDRAGRVVSKSVVAIDPAARWQRSEPPGFAVEQGRWALATTDGQGSIQLGTGAVAASLTLARVADGADPRFSPSVAWHGGRAQVAFTASSSGGMEVRALSMGTAAVQTLTPPRMSATCPTLVVSENKLTLFFLDARQGISALLHAEVLADGTLAPPENVAVLRNLAEPPRVTAITAGETTHVAYTALGAGATSAIGWIASPEQSSPRALVRGTGYGVLAMDAARLGARAVFVAERPLDRDPRGPRVVEVRVNVDSELGAPTELRAASGSARLPSVAVLGDETIGVAFSDGAVLFFQGVRCD